MRPWVFPILVVLVGLMVFGYIDDGPPYWQTDDLRSPEWHHEKLIILTGLTGFMVVVLGSDVLGRREKVYFIAFLAVLMATIIGRANGLF